MVRRHFSLCVMLFLFAALAHAEENGLTEGLIYRLGAWKLTCDNTRTCRAVEVLAQMDEFQGRTGTAGALIRKDSAGEGSVKNPLSPPVLYEDPLMKKKSGDREYFDNALNWLGKKLDRIYTEYCGVEERVYVPDDLYMSDNLAQPDFLCLIFFLSTVRVHAERGSLTEGLGYGLGDWGLTCDNTRTCRAAGYQEDDYGKDERRWPISILFTRKAGANQTVKVELQRGIMEDDEDDRGERMMTLWINGKSTEKIFHEYSDIDNENAELLLRAIEEGAVIEWREHSDIWRLSSEGAAEVLAKMDGFQGRTGTTGALIYKGNADESNVKKPLPLPVLYVKSFTKWKSGDEEFFRNPPDRLRKKLERIYTEYCGKDEYIYESNDLTRLDKNRVLFAKPCWQTNFNQWVAIWILNDSPPYRAVFITSEATESPGGDGFISQIKGTVHGECTVSRRWAWTGEKFMLSSVEDTGACKWIANGGAWSFPRLITEVREYSEN